jgi:hypothetical protein
MTNQTHNPANEPDYEAIRNTIYEKAKMDLEEAELLDNPIEETLRRLRNNPEVLAKFLEGSGYYKLDNAIGDFLRKNDWINVRDKEKLKAALAAANNEKDRRIDIENEMQDKQGELAAAQKRVKELENCLSELAAVVRGESPSLLIEDSGGDAELEYKITKLLAKGKDEV